MIHIDGDYENGGDAFHYDIYLRPWGTYWVDVDEEDLPNLYDSWYLRVIDVEEPMPYRMGCHQNGDGWRAIWGGAIPVCAMGWSSYV